VSSWRLPPFTAGFRDGSRSESPMRYSSASASRELNGGRSRGGTETDGSPQSSCCPTATLQRHSAFLVNIFTIYLRDPALLGKCSRACRCLAAERHADFTSSNWGRVANLCGIGARDVCSSCPDIATTNPRSPCATTRREAPPTSAGLSWCSKGGSCMTRSEPCPCCLLYQARPWLCAGSAEGGCLRVCSRRLHP